MIFVHHAAFYACFICTVRRQHMQWHTQLSNCNYFDYEKKTWRPPIWAPCRDKDGTVCRISGAYLCSQLQSNLRYPNLPCIFCSTVMTFCCSASCLRCCLCSTRRLSTADRASMLSKSIYKRKIQVIKQSKYKPNTCNCTVLSSTKISIFQNQN